MNVYTNITFTGHWPVGTAAVVVANTQEQAAFLLEEELEKIGLKQKIDPKEMERISTYRPKTIILQDGNY